METCPREPFLQIGNYGLSHFDCHAMQGPWLLLAALAATAVTPVYVPLSNSFPYEVGDIKHFLVLFMENRAFGTYTW